MQEKNENKIRCHAELVSASSTQVVMQRNNNCVRGRFQIKFGMTPLFNNGNGFTLIELLVVVLIIGILAAVAVPQYQKAVDKSRAVKCLVGLRALRTAQESYYLANGRISNDFTELDIDFTNNFNQTHTQAYAEGIWYDIGGEYSLCGISEGLGGALHLLAFYPPNTVDALYQGSYFCRSASDRAEKICRALGGKRLGSRGSYQVYSLD